MKWLKVKKTHNSNLDIYTFHKILCFSGKQSNHIFQLLFSTASLRVRQHCANARRIRCHADLNSFPLGELEETTGTSPYYVDEDYPAGPGINEPLPERSNWRGSKLSTLKNDVYIWRYALIVVHARNEWMNKWMNDKILSITVAIGLSLYTGIFLLSPSW